MRTGWTACGTRRTPPYRHVGEVTRHPEKVVSRWPEIRWIYFEHISFCSMCLLTVDLRRHHQFTSHQPEISKENRARENLNRWGRSKCGNKMDRKYQTPYLQLGKINFCCRFYSRVRWGHRSSTCNFFGCSVKNTCKCLSFEAELIRCIRSGTITTMTIVFALFTRSLR